MEAKLSTRPSRPSRVRINPEYADFLAALDLATARDFLRLPGVVVSGHPDRHVMQVTLGHGIDALTCFLKREHRVPWRVRLTNAWAGFGFASQSHREADLLRGLRHSGVPGPDWLAVGVDRHGCSFLLVREIVGGLDLRVFLQGQRGRATARRRQLARKLGEALAHMHDIGFDHGDLYSKHVLVNPRDLQVHFLDWQRGRKRSHVSWPRRWHDLAALDATLTEELASSADRLACLHAYLKATVPGRPPRAFRRRAAQEIADQARRLLRHRHVREARQMVVESGEQRVIWLDGEALCVTPAFRAALDQPPSWLGSETTLQRHRDSTQATVALPGPLHATLVRRRADWSLRWLGRWLVGRHIMSREVRQAGLLFRLQRAGIATPRLLAFGQKHFPPRRTESFLLTETPTRSVPLTAWLAAQTRKPMWNAERKQRANLLRAAGRLLRRLHDGRCCFARRADAARLLHVEFRSGGGPIVMLGSVGGVVLRRRLRPRRALHDLARFHAILSADVCSRTDALRGLLAYFDVDHVTPHIRQVVRKLLRKPPATLLHTLRRLLPGRVAG